MTRTQNQPQRQRDKSQHKFETKHNIKKCYPQRTLKRSARTQLERERAAMWIAPWIANSQWRLEHNNYPRASFLGLPTELRQEILYMSGSVEDLEENLKDSRQKLDMNDEQLWRMNWSRLTTRTKISPKTSARLQLKPEEGNLLTLLGQQAAELSRISPTTRQDMEIVAKRWKRDLAQHVHRTSKLRPKDKLPEVATDDLWCLSDEVKELVKLLTKKERKGETVMAQSHRVPGVRYRPRKCWYCTQRHFEGDPVCPLQRRDPAAWEKLTKKVGGRKARMHARSSMLGRKVVFGD
ncbi:hypothetical protein ACN47E_008559 [Coniothyrium glycines]